MNYLQIGTVQGRTDSCVDKTDTHGYEMLCDSMFHLPFLFLLLFNQFFESLFL